MPRSSRLLLFSWLALAGPVLGQAVPSSAPSSTHIFPAGGRRGTVVPVRVGGECLPPGSKFHVWAKGLTAPEFLGPRAKTSYEPSPRRIPTDADGRYIGYPKEWTAQVVIAADAPLGPAPWRVTCGWGGTRPRPFIVGELPEFVETEPNSDAEHAETVHLPVTVNGQIAGERDVDFFRFAARAGQVVVCDVLARRLDSPLDPVVEVRDSAGRRLPLQQLRVGGDPVVALRVPADGDYLLNIANLGFQGGPEYVYRFTLSASPFVAWMFPNGGRPGETRDFELFALTGTDSFRSWKEKITPSAPAGQLRDRTAACLEVGDAPEVVAPDSQPSDRPLPLAVPASVSGRLLTAASENVFCFQAKKGETFSLVCRPFPAVSVATPIVTLEDATGHALARASAVDRTDRFCRLEWQAPADGRYHILVRDLQHGSRGGPEFLYRLAIKPAHPDFNLELADDHVNVLQGGKAELDLSIRHTGGFTGPIELVVSGLPAGVRVEPTRIAENQDRVKLVFSAGDDTRPVNALLRVTGKAVLGGNARERLAVATPADGWEGVSAVLPNDAVHLTVQHKPLFRLTCNEAYQYAPRGTVHPYLLKVERLNGFDGNITLQICDRQVQDLDGIDVVERVVPPGVKEIPALIYLPETMHANVQHHCRPYVQGHASFTDRWGQKQAMLALCDKRCMIRTMPSVVKLRAVDAEVVARPGATSMCQMVLERTTNFPGPIEVELAEADATVGIRADKIAVMPGQTSVAMPLRVDPTAPRAKTTLRFRATGKLPGMHAVISEATVVLRVE